MKEMRDLAGDAQAVKEIKANMKSKINFFFLLRFFYSDYKSAWVVNCVSC